MSRLGHSIRILRQARGLTSASVAASAGISAAYLSLIESGVRIPPDETLDKLAGALRVNPSVLKSIATGAGIYEREGPSVDLARAIQHLADAEAALKRKLA